MFLFYIFNFYKELTILENQLILEILSISFKCKIIKYSISISLCNNIIVNTNFNCFNDKI
jgi:hypothetical protein